MVRLGAVLIFFVPLLPARVTLAAVPNTFLQLQLRNLKSGALAMRSVPMPPGTNVTRLKSRFGRGEISLSEFHGRFLPSTDPRELTVEVPPDWSL